MKFNTSLPKKLNFHFQKELSEYKKELNCNNLPKAWSHLERAHVIGQSFPFAHSFVHYKMLQFGIKIKSPNEVLGQIPRLLIGGVKSFVGKVPIGNTGGSNIPPFKQIRLEKDIELMFESVQIVKR